MRATKIHCSHTSVFWKSGLAAPAPVTSHHRVWALSTCQWSADESLHQTFIKTEEVSKFSFAIFFLKWSTLNLQRQIMGGHIFWARSFEAGKAVPISISKGCIKWSSLAFTSLYFVAQGMEQCLVRIIWREASLQFLRLLCPRPVVRIMGFGTLLF